MNVPQPVQLSWFFLRDSLSLVQFNNNPLYFENAKRLEGLVLESDLPYNAFLFASNVINYDITKVQEVILSKDANFLSVNSYAKNCWYAFLFAKDVKGANIEALESLVWSSQDKSIIAKFGCEVNVLDIEKYEKYILESKIPKLAYNFLKSKKCKNPLLFKDILIKSKKPRYIFEIAKYLTTEEKMFLEDLIVASKSDMYVRLYAQHIEGADIKRLERRIIQTKSTYQIEKFSKSVKGSSCARLKVMF